MRLKILFTICLSAILFPPDADPGVKNQDYRISPYFNEHSCLQTLHLPSPETSVGCQSQPRIKNDRNGLPWIVWRKRTQQEWDIRLGQIHSGDLTNEISVAAGFPGRHSSPDLDFSAGNKPWIAWINQTGGTWRLLAQNAADSQTWEITTSRKPVFTPDIIGDRNGRIWIFWTGAESGYDQIFSSFWEYGEWSRPQCLTPDASIPHFHPAATLTAAGRPMVVWSAFDGADYRLYTRSWTGSGWDEIVPLPHAPGTSDAEPASLLLGESIPVVVWTRSGPAGSQIFLSYQIGADWSPPIRLTDYNSPGRHPVLASAHDQLAVMWENRQGFVIQKFTFSELLEKPVPLDFTVSPLAPAFLIENKFIAFGDSITYGSTNGPRMGKGYPPRLQILLEQIFIYPYVANKGLPGEPTWHALGRIQSVLTHEMARSLLLMEGTNDVSVQTYSLDATVFNLEQMIFNAEEYGTFPLLSTIIPRARSRWTTSARVRTLELNEKIIQLADDLNIMLVDNYSAFIQYPFENGGYEALISDDNLHPNDTGYQIMAETWYDSIRFIPYPPENITALRMYRDRKVRLRWAENPKNDPNAGITHYRILRRLKDSQSGFYPVGVALASQNEYTDNAISLETDYVYAMRAMNSEGIEGPPSAPVTPVRGDPFPPINVAVETAVNRAFLYREVINRISWNTNPQNQGLFSISEYRIYRKQSGEEDDRFALIGEVAAGTGYFLDRNLTSEETAENYVYGISAVTQNGIEGIIGKG